MQTISILAQSDSIITNLSRFFRKHGFNCVVNGDIKEICIIESGTSEELPLKIIKENPTTSVFVLSDIPNIKDAINIIRAGAKDYIPKPFLPDMILESINKHALSSPIRVSTISEKTVVVKKEQQDFIYGTSKAVKSMLKEIDAVSGTNYNVIIFGESGVGKEMVAKMIHEKSGRGKFIAIDCGTLSRELAASELFGHVKGAFTGALVDKAGAFEYAEGGTLFFDEIGNMPKDIQALLLRVIQERNYKRVGSIKEYNMDVRIIVASNVDLHSSFSAGTFREDLYHRLNEFSIRVPSLSERQEDIELYISHFLKRANAELNKNVILSQDVIASLISHPWPGNLRELINLIRRTVLLTKSPIVNYIDDLLIKSENKIDDAVKEPVVSNSALKSVAKSAEYGTIIEALKKTNFNKSRAAVLLGVDRKTLYNKMKFFELAKTG